MCKNFFMNPLGITNKATSTTAKYKNTGGIVATDGLSRHGYCGIHLHYYYYYYYYLFIYLVRITETARADIRCLAVRSPYMKMCNEVSLPYRY